MKKPKNNNPQLFKIDEQMREWSVLLADEVRRWPRVEAKKMFGMVSLYANEVIFAAVPDKRTIFNAYTIIFKLNPTSKTQSKRMKSDPRVNLSFGIGQKWFGFELGSSDDLRGALEWIGEAYEVALLAKKPKRQMKKVLKKKIASSSRKPSREARK